MKLLKLVMRVINVQNVAENYNKLKKYFVIEKIFIYLMY